MKIIDQYVEVVGQHLPFKGRGDIKRELKSLLLDQLDEECGQNPTEDDAKRILRDFGSPKIAAGRYAGVRVPITPAYSDLYFLIIKIVPFALFIAFTVIFVLELILENLSGAGIFASVGRNLLNILNGSVSGIGVVSLIFILISRLSKSEETEEEWSMDELDSVVIEGVEESPGGIIVGMIFLLLFILLMLFAPRLITAAESSFLKSGLSLGHRINIDVFRKWSVFLVLICSAEIAGQAVLLKAGKRSKGFRTFEMIISLCSIFVLGLMIADGDMYINNLGYIGFKLIFIIIIVVNSAELIGSIARILLKKNG